VPSGRTARKLPSSLAPPRDTHLLAGGAESNANPPIQPMGGAARALPGPTTRFIETSYGAEQLMRRCIDVRRSHCNVIAEAIDLFTRELSITGVGFVHGPTYHAFLVPLNRPAHARSRHEMLSRASRSRKHRQCAPTPIVTISRTKMRQWRFRRRWECQLHSSNDCASASEPRSGSLAALAKGDGDLRLRDLRLG